MVCKRSVAWCVAMLLCGGAVVGMEGDQEARVSCGQGNCRIFFSIATALGDQEPAIFEAISRRDSPRVSELLANGVSANCSDVCGMHPIHHAAQIGCVSIIEMLLAAGESADVSDAFFGERPLHYAVRSGNLGAAARLIEAGAAVDSEDKWRTTPLLLAVRGGRVLLTRILLEEGANPVLTNADGLSAYDYAHLLGHRSIARMVRRAACGEDLRAGMPGDTSTETLSTDFYRDDVSASSLPVSGVTSVSASVSPSNLAATPALRRRPATI